MFEAGIMFDGVKLTVFHNDQTFIHHWVKFLCIVALYIHASIILDMK